MRGGYNHLSILITRQKKREELGIPLDARWLLNVGELIPRKNQETIIRAVAQIEGIYLTIAGKGVLFDELSSLIVELRVNDRVKLLGYRSDISELCKSCDIFAFPSFHEGLPVSVMEAMASGLPIACSNIRGNTDLVDENGGALFAPSNLNSCKVAIDKILSTDLRQMGHYNLKKVNTFSQKRVNEQMSDIIKR